MGKRAGVKSSEKVSVFDYTDYRRYLSDYYKKKKENNPSFSYRTFLQKVEVKSSGFYKELVDGKRNLGRTLIHRFSKALSHTNREKEYFENMVYFCEANNIEEKRLYFKKMITCYEAAAYKIHKDQYEYFSKWYYCAVREIIACHDFKKNDIPEIAKTLKPGIRNDQAEKAVKILEKLNFIYADDDGYLRRTQSVISTGYPEKDSNVDLVNIVNYQKTMMKKSEEFYKKSLMKKVDMSTLTLSISEETYNIIKEEIADFRKKLLSIAEREENPDRVYQVNYQFFPLTKVD